MNAAHWRISLVFALHAVANAMLHTRVPDIQVALGLGDGALVLVLMGAPLGSMLVFPFASRVIERFGTRNVCSIAFIAMLAPVPLMPLARDATLLFALMAINGAGASLAAMTFNVEADRVEAAMGRRIMNSCHGAWSLGYLIASSAGGVVRGAGVSPSLHLLIVAPVLLAIIVLVLRSSQPAPARAFGPSPVKRRFVLPSLLLLSLVAVGLGAELLEGASRIWATILLRDSFDVPALVESSALPAMVVTMAFGRLVADRWIDRYGPVRVARLLLAIAFVGLLGIAVADHPIVVIVGFAVLGLGICVIYPLSISAAARIGDGPSSQNVATLTLIIQIVMLVAPMFTGLVAEHFGVQVAFGALLPLVALGWAMSGTLDVNASRRPVPA
jgi:MFS family permease